MSKWPLKVVTSDTHWVGWMGWSPAMWSWTSLLILFLLNISSAWWEERAGLWRPALFPVNIYLMQWGLWAQHDTGWWQRHLCPCFQVVSSSPELLARDQHCLWCSPKAALPLPCLPCSSERHSKKHLLLLLIEEFPFVSLLLKGGSVQSHSQQHFFVCLWKSH